MKSNFQKTIGREVDFSGAGLHTGCKVNVRLIPAPENSGINFVRVDLPQRPILKDLPDHIMTTQGLPRCTSIGQGQFVIHTVEHLMSVLCGLEINNLTVEIDGHELPGLDGSGLEFLTAIKKAGIVEQSAVKRPLVVREPVGVHRNGSSLFVVPDDEFKISYVLDYPHPLLRSQFLHITVTGETFEREIAPSRTFCLEEEARELLDQGLGKGANYQNTLVVGDGGVIQNTLRFPDEFVRHKVLDLIGDLYLCGRPIRGHVFAVKSGHNLNIGLLKRILKQNSDCDLQGYVPQYDFSDKKNLDIQQIMKILPHRYPFLLVDRIIEIEHGKKAVGVKNVTMNEQFFTGHFPSRPIMPGVLMVEAMAQTGGVIVLSNEAHHGKVALFMAVDNVKFRRLVEPGDQLLLEVEVVKDKARVAMLHGQAKVAGEVVAEADLWFSFTDSSFLDSSRVS